MGKFTMKTVVVGMAIVVFVARDASAIELATVVAGLKDRESKIQNLDIEWEATNYYAPQYGQKLGASPFDDKSEKDKSATNAFRSTTLTWRGRLVIAGAQLRFEHNIPLWNFPTREFVQNKSVHAYDGTTETRFTEWSQSGIPRAGGIRNDDKFVRDEATIAWMIAHAQPTHPESYLSSILTPEAEFSEMDVDGSTYVVGKSQKMNRANGLANGTIVWLDPQRQWCIHRVSKTRGGAPNRDVRISYVVDDSGIWIPSSWSDEEFNSQGQLLKSISAKVTRAALNQTLDAALFQFQFPENTFVTDERKDAPIHHSVELASGEKLPLEKRDFDVGQGNITKIVASAQQRQGRGWSIPITVAILIALAIVGLVLVRTRRHSSV